MHGVLFLRQIVLEMKLFDLEEKSLQKEGGKSGYRPKFVFEIWLCPCTDQLICHFTEVCCRKEFYQTLCLKKGNHKKLAFMWMNMWGLLENGEIRDDV